MGENKTPVALKALRVAVDIGSTIVKIARIGPDDKLLSQAFYPRDFKVGIAKQVEALLDSTDGPLDKSAILICSSANGGLRIGIVCLTEYFSGSVFRNQALLAGANPIFVHSFENKGSNIHSVDILLVGGGIDCQDSGPLLQRLKCFKPSNYRFDSLIYAGNKFLAEKFLEWFPEAKVIQNPLADGIRSAKNSVFETLRSAYLDDLVYKEGVSELKNTVTMSIRPTPEIVNRGFHRAVFNHSSIEVSGACILIDIGGATTDVHYTVEVISEESENRPLPNSSIARYVFTDLGIVASKDSTLLQLQGHPRLYEFLTVVVFNDDVREVYQLLREGVYSPLPELLSYACLFLSCDRFLRGRGVGLPVVNFDKLTQIILTGGAAQGLDELIIVQIVNLFLLDKSIKPKIFIDRCYQVWVDGITWAGHEAE